MAGGMDQGAGAVGVGNIAGRSISESTGGALTLQATVDRHGGDPSGQTPVYVHSAPDRYLYCPVCPTGGMALTWFRDQFGAEEVARAAHEGRSAYDLLTELAAAVSPGADGLTMLPHLMGAFSPEYEPEARGVFYGFTLHHGKPHFVRAVLEAVAFMLRRNLELLASAGAPATEIRSHGGGARSAALEPDQGRRLRPARRDAGRARTPPCAVTRCSPAWRPVRSRTSRRPSRRWSASSAATNQTLPPSGLRRRLRSLRAAVRGAPTDVPATDPTRPR